jgi:cytochrome c553
MEGRVTPKDINIMLSTMGQSAKKLSDDGIINLAAMLSVQRQDAGG